MLRNADGGGGVKFSGKKRYEGVRFNVISITRGWVGVQIPGKKRYITLEWPLGVQRLRSWPINEEGDGHGEDFTNELFRTHHTNRCITGWEQMRNKQYNRIKKYII